MILDLRTETEAVFPAVAMFAAGTVTVNWVAEELVMANCVPPKSTPIGCGVNPEPLIVRGKAGPPGGAAAGVSGCSMVGICATATVLRRSMQTANVLEDLMTLSLGSKVCSAAKKITCAKQTTRQSRTNSASRNTETRLPQQPGSAG